MSLHSLYRFVMIFPLTLLISLSFLVVSSYSADEEGKEKSGVSVIADKQRLRKNSDIKVVMYMTDWCPYCKRAGKYLKSLGVRLVEYDIDKDENRKDEMRRINGGSGMVPLIDVEGIIIRGYVPEEIESAIEERKKQ
ncbi:MAG: hypothetical protein OEW04_06045 [Nitrospirota bacterium]|nr:hypothetical protein [Nitrospirota bacterium]